MNSISINKSDASSEAYQHLQYLPLRQAQGGAFGEDYIYQRNSSWNVPYTFSGKEKDAEIKLLDIAELKFLSKRFRLSISIKFVIAFSTKTN